MDTAKFEWEVLKDASLRLHENEDFKVWMGQIALLRDQNYHASMQPEVVKDHAIIANHLGYARAMQDVLDTFEQVISEVKQDH